jgi:hypothetical protein
LIPLRVLRVLRAISLSFGTSADSRRGNSPHLHAIRAGQRN